MYIQMQIYIQMDIIVPYTWRQHTIALININYNKKTRNSCYPTFLTQINCTKLPFINLEKCHWIYKEITKITYQMTETGHNKQHSIK